MSQEFAFAVACIIALIIFHYMTCLYVDEIQQEQEFLKMCPLDTLMKPSVAFLEKKEKERIDNVVTGTETKKQTKDKKRD
jgi:hypothetical protein